MTAPIALQLYTLREHLANDYAGSVEAVAEMGYAGVETAGFPGTTPREAGRLFRSLGLAVASAHLPLPIGDDRDDVLRTAEELECTNIICAHMPPTAFMDKDSVREVADTLNDAGRVAAQHGLTFFYHNHWWEFTDIAGKSAYDILLEYLSDDVQLEVDVYWAQTAGVNPVALVERLGPRAPLLHIKDGPCTEDDPMVAVGDGAVDIPAVVQAGAGTTDWLIVELDRHDGDMIDAVARSYDYMTTKGLAHGR